MPSGASTPANVTRYREQVAKPRSPKGRARLVIERLAVLYPGTAKELCALDHENPFQLLAATILSAQCTDARVNMVTPALFAKYPDPAALAAANPEDVEEIIRSTGFFHAKTKSLIGMASAVAERFGGEVPEKLEDLVTLPGVGRKTGNVVRSVDFGAAWASRRHPRAPGQPAPGVARRDEPQGSGRRGQGGARPQRVGAGPGAGGIQPAHDLARPEHMCCTKAPLRRSAS